MRLPTHNDLDFLGARLHGHRARLAEGRRLDGLCQLRSLSEFGRAMYPDTEFRAATDIQRRLEEDLVREMTDCLRHLAGAGANLVYWMRTRFEIENLKLLLRGALNQVPLGEMREYLLPVPSTLGMDTEALATATSLDDFMGRLPRGMLLQWLRYGMRCDREQSRPFFSETALDRGYLQELIARAEALPEEEKETVKPVVVQEADSFQLMLVLRGRFHYGLTPELLRPLRVRGCGISATLFSAMCGDPDPLTAAARTLGRALDEVPSPEEKSSKPGRENLAVVEALAWKRFLRFANRAFRRSHNGLGAVVGYLGIRRIEAANLIRVSEGIRAGVSADALRRRLMPHEALEAVHV